MRSGRARNVRSTDQRRDVGTRIAKRCRFQINVRGIASLLRLFFVILPLAVCSRTLVYAAEPSVFTLTLAEPNAAFTSSSKDVYRGGSITHEDVLEYFGDGDNLTFTLESVKYLRYELEGTGNVSVSEAAVDSYYIKCTPASGGSTVTTWAKLGEEVTLSYGGSGLSIVVYPSIGKLTNASLGANCRVYCDFTFKVPSKPLSDNEALNEIVDQNNKFHQEELDKGEQSGSDASQMVQDLTDQVKSKWEILFYPIEFTKKFLALFTSSSSGATSLTFPAFSLEVQGSTYQVWEEYTYDLSTLKTQFSILFNGLHMIVGVLEVTWFIKYLYSKYDSIFGGGD